MLGQLGFNDAPWIGARGVQRRAPGAIYRSGVLPGQLTDVRRVISVDDVHVRQSFPAPAKANHFPAHFACAVHHGLNYWIQARDISSTCQDSDLLSLGHIVSSLLSVQFVIKVLPRPA